MMKLIHNILLILTGICLIYYTLWNRLFRVRLPKDIPLSLSILSTGIIISVILVFFHLLLIRLNIRKQKENSINTFINKTYIAALSAFENLILNSTKKISDKLIVYQYHFIDYCKKKDFNFTIIYWCFIGFPRVLVGILFILDIFINSKLNYFYKGLPLLLMPLIFNYIVYRLTALFDLQCALLSEKIHIFNMNKGEPLFGEYTSVKDYINYKVQLQHNLHVTDFNFIVKISPSFIEHIYFTKKRNLDTKLTLKNCNNILKSLIAHYNLLFTYESIKNRYHNRVLCFVYISYIIGWSYILFISFHTLTLPDLTHVILYIKIPGNPFN